MDTDEIKQRIRGLNKTYTKLYPTQEPANIRHNANLIAMNTIREKIDILKYELDKRETEK